MSSDRNTPVSTNMSPEISRVNDGSIYNFEIMGEDIEEGVPLQMNLSSTGLEDTDVLRYIEKFVLNEGFYDFYNQTLPNVFEHPNMSVYLLISKLCLLLFFIETNLLWTEDPATGIFIPVKKRSAADSLVSQHNSAEQTVEADDKQLENVPFFSKINLNDDSNADNENEMLFPPRPPVNSAQQNELDQRIGRSDDWIVVTMEYQNFSFLKRMAFVFFQVFSCGLLRSFYDMFKGYLSRILFRYLLY
jgi:hypothetical protein